MVYQIVISGTIGSWWNGCSADYVRYVLNENKGKEVHVGFCSLGGYVKDGLEMNQAFKDHGDVHAHAFGMNASISTIAMLGCKTIDIVKGSFFLIHNAWSYIEQSEAANKEKIDEYISELRKQREDLNTIDDVMALMYSEKTGRSMEECAAQMKKGNWLSAQQAKDFGLVDEIREDKETENAAAEYNQQFMNQYNLTIKYKDAGIPPLPGTQDDSIASLVDGDGNPTPSFLQKTWQGLQNLIHNQHAQKINDKMIKVFMNVMTLLAITDGFKPEDNGDICLTQDQMKKIDDRLVELENNHVKDAGAIKAAGDAVTKLQAQLAQKDEQIATLKAAAGAETVESPSGTGNGVATAKELYDLIKDV